MTIKWGFEENSKMYEWGFKAYYASHEWGFEENSKMYEWGFKAYYASHEWGFGVKSL